MGLTRAQIRSRARTRADQPGTFPTDTEYNEFIDDGAKEVQYDLIGAGWPISFSTATVSITSVNQARLSDFGVTGTVAFVRGVFRIDGSTITELHRIPEGSRDSLLSTTGGYASHYAAYVSPSEGTIVEILPLQAGSYLVHYIKEFAGFSADNEVWYGPALSDQLIVLKGAIKGLRKEGDDQGARELEREYAEMFEKVVRMASWFDMRNAPTIRDTHEQMTPIRLPFDFDI